MTAETMRDFYRLTALNQRQAGIMLGMTAVPLRRYERGAFIPRHVRLAMAAIIAGLEPFDTSKWHISRAGDNQPNGETK